MGPTFISLRLRALTGDVSLEIDLQVDTGSTYSWIPRKALEGLRIEPKGTWPFRTAKGERVFREVGDVIVEWEGQTGPTTVVFAQEGDAPAFGTHGLDSLGLEVDPVTGGVRRREHLLALDGEEGTDVQSILEEEMRAMMDGIPEIRGRPELKRLRVVWSPRSDHGLPGKLAGNELLIYETEASKAVEALRHYVRDFLTSFLFEEYREIALGYLELTKELAGKRF